MKDWVPNGDAYFQQDNAPCHVDKAYMAEKGIPCLKWPPVSPGLNPIENQQSIVKHGLKTMEDFSKKKIIENFVKVWHKDPEKQKNVLFWWIRCHEESKL